MAQHRLRGRRGKGDGAAAAALLPGGRPGGAQRAPHRGSQEEADGRGGARGRGAPRGVLPAGAPGLAVPTAQVLAGLAAHDVPQAMTQARSAWQGQRSWQHSWAASLCVSSAQLVEHVGCKSCLQSQGLHAGRTCLPAFASTAGSICPMPEQSALLWSHTVNFRPLCRYDVIWIQWALLYLTDGVPCPALAPA